MGRHRGAAKHGHANATRRARTRASKHGPQRPGAPAAQPIRTRRAWSIGLHRWSEAARSGRVGLKHNPAPCPRLVPPLPCAGAQAPAGSFSAATLVFVLMAFHAEPAWKPIGLVALRVYLPALMALLVYSSSSTGHATCQPAGALGRAGAGRPWWCRARCWRSSWPRCARASRPSGWCRVRYGASWCTSSWAPWSARGWRWRPCCASATPTCCRAERAAASSSSRRWTRSCACCRRRWSRTSSSTRLANVQALVDAGSPRARPCWPVSSPTCAPPCPGCPSRTTASGRSWTWCAYLALMQLRMPDRLTFSIDAEPGLETPALPALMLMTLVENAVRHGIDPSLGGGIEVNVGRFADGRCLAEVRDTGVGLQPTSNGLGTGLQSPRERLQASFEGAAELRLSDAPPMACWPRSSSQPVHDRHHRPDHRTPCRRRAPAARGIAQPAGPALARAAVGGRGAQWR